MEIPVNGFFKVERTDKTGEKLYGIYKDGKEVAETKYQGVKIDPQGKGAVLYGKSDGRRNYKEIYLLDFKNNKTTPFPYSRWGDGDIKNGWVRKVVRNSRGADEDEYYDFSGEKVL
ncbi:MAG: hypothetical protein K2M10_10540 [Muribaculaceae bacterium]|nr:hypothetical protein [Muribaculaceae bacterium]